MAGTAPDREEKEKKVTFITKDRTKCPVCEAQFQREELFSGRVNAGELTDELHRTYIPMHAFGEIHPLVYELTVCPSCWYSAYRYDFGGITPKIAESLNEGISARVDATQRVFDSVDFSSPRDLLEGAASYYLAMICYESFTKDYAPTAKQALSSLRAAWLCDYLEARRPGENFAAAALLFHQKARFLYKLSLELDQKGKERLGAVKWLGPDTDKNYGFEGVLYVAAALELKYGPREDPAARNALLDASKRTLAKMFGLGKKSKAKPGPLVDKVRDLYDRLKAELHQEGDDDED